MTTTIIVAALILGAGLLVWILSRGKKQARHDVQHLSGHGPELLQPVVGSLERHADPYPYIYVNSDGTARELHASEREYLEASFRPTDPARPYVKARHEQKNGWGETRGFMNRSELPAWMSVDLAPAVDPSEPKEHHDRFLQFPKTHAGWAADEDDSEAARRLRR